MGMPRAAGTPNYSGIFIPEVWSGQLLMRLYEALVSAHITNTDYEGEIKALGDTVHIRIAPDITIRDYVRGQKLIHETPNGSSVDLSIDQSDYYSFISDDVAKAQADKTYLQKWTTVAATKMKIVIDRKVLSYIAGNVHAKNCGDKAGAQTGLYDMGKTGAPLLLDKTNIVEYIVDAGTVLDEQNVPDDEDRWMVMAPWQTNLIKKSELRDAQITGDSVSSLRSGIIGKIDNTTIFKSNLLPFVIDNGKRVTKSLFGTKRAVTFALQLLQNEGPMRADDYFGDLYRGLQVYGRQVIQPEAVGVMQAAKA